MWAKATLFKDKVTADATMRADIPRRSKALGRTVGGFGQALWDANKFQIVVRGDLAKFGQNEQLRQDLLAIGGHAPIAEISEHDRTWGIGLALALAQGDPRSADRGWGSSRGARTCWGGRWWRCESG